jgi:mono/diheme cytochrome c family protein
MRLAPAILVLTLALGAGCGGGSEETLPEPAPSAEPESTAEPAPAPAPGPMAEPEPMAEPASGEPDVAAGAQLYATYCASCHGAEGHGDGPVSAGLNPKPARHDDAEYMSTLSDEHIFTVIKEGGPAVGKSPLMAPWGGTLSDDQIHDLVAFVRTLAE